LLLEPIVYEKSVYKKDTAKSGTTVTLKNNRGAPKASGAKIKK
jgi:hypothetical protein